MSAQLPDDDPHAKFRDLCMLYGDFNRSVFLEEILHFIAGFGATKTELSAIRSAVQKRAKQLPKRAQKGRPRSSDDRVWMRGVVAAAYQRYVMKWSWPRVTEAQVKTPTKANIRTVQRQIAQWAKIIADAIPPQFLETVISSERYETKLREGAVDSKRAQLWLTSKTGLRFDTRPEDCRKLVEAVLSTLTITLET
jgi:hypothetical protein